MAMAEGGRGGGEGCGRWWSLLWQTGRGCSGGGGGGDDSDCGRGEGCWWW